MDHSSLDPMTSYPQISSSLGGILWGRGEWVPSKSVISIRWSTLGGSMEGYSGGHRRSHWRLRVMQRRSWGINLILPCRLMITWMKKSSITSRYWRRSTWSPRLQLGSSRRRIRRISYRPSRINYIISLKTIGLQIQWNSWVGMILLLIWCRGMRS